MVDSQTLGQSEAYRVSAEAPLLSGCISSSRLLWNKFVLRRSTDSYQNRPSEQPQKKKVASFIAEQRLCIFAPQEMYLILR